MEMWYTIDLGTITPENLHYNVGNFDCALFVSDNYYSYSTVTWF